VEKLAMTISLADVFPAGQEFSDREAAEIVSKVFKSVAKPAPANVLEPTLYVVKNPALIPRRPWLYGTHLIRRHVSATASAGAVGKTSLKIVEALCMASGKPLLGKEVIRPLNVWLFNLEDDRDEMDRRIAAAMKHFDLRPQDIDGRLYVEADKSLVITNTTGAGTQIRTPIIDGLVDAIIRKGIDALLVDPFVSSHDAPENDSGAMDKIVKQGWVKVAREGNCAVELVHHVTKSAASTGEATALSARGSGAFINACRSVHVLNPMSQVDGEKAGVSNHLRFFSVIDDKENLAPKTGRQDWYEMVGVDLGNGGPGNLSFLYSDKIGVCTKWHWPSRDVAMADVPQQELERIKEGIRLGDFRADPQARHWAGKVVAEIMGIDLDEKGAKGKVKRVIQAMIDSGHLQVVEHRDARREIQTFVEVKDPAGPPDQNPSAGPAVR
jgi:hypothetical protein